MRGFVRGFIGGTLALVVVYVAVQPGTAAKTQQGGGLLVAALRAMFDPGRAGIGNHAQAGTTDTLNPASPSAGTGGGSIPKFT